MPRKIQIVLLIALICSSSNRAQGPSATPALDRTQITENYVLTPPVAIEPLDRALTDITRKYPNFKWIDYGDDAVRVVDGLARTDMLNVRVRGFRLQGITTPELAASSIWSIPEVENFAATHHINFVAIVSGMVPPDGMYTRISVDVHDATVAEIMDKISQSYRRTDDPSWHSVWIYHECESRGKRVVELKIY